ncbi:MAG TPA: hypothetical protein VGN82_23265 [Bosea sp. (in: a-proteobacteria)]|nr:hypothetical protein [Bosea sp. (in: a-proteobacteria)]
MTELVYLLLNCRIAAARKVAKIDRIEWVALTEASAVVGALMQGEVDWYE